MPPRREVRLPLLDPGEDPLGHLILRVPPRRDFDERPYPLVDAREVSERDTSLAPVQLLESEEYLYEVELAQDLDGSLEVSPDKLFDPDTETGDRGRLRPGLHTGQLSLQFASDGIDLGDVRLEIRSRKLDYLRHYRWMLDDIAREMSELVMQRFAPTQQRFEVDEGMDASTLYQRFAFLRSLLESEVFEGAVQYVLRRPYRTWTSEPEWRSPGRGIPPGSGVARQLAGPGERVEAGPLQARVGMRSVPRRIRVDRTEETRDNVPNRFLRFAFERWRDVVTQIQDLLAAKEPTGPVERGLRESRELIDRLDTILAHELFRTCGELNSFPASNQVLHKREGYRNVFRAYIQFEAAAQLSWTGGEDVYGAGQRDVATLYEYWVYLQLGREISELCDEPFAFEELIQGSDDGLTLQLKKGSRRILSGKTRRLGRTLDAELWFNRTFRSTMDPKESWTRAMRPDCSLRIRSSDPDGAFFHREVWLHFDAKYRVDRPEEALGEEAADAEEEERLLEQEEEAETRGRSKREDLVKMHAYRDAIERSSGAYVIYPGNERATHRRYHEILPGLGAFALSPTQGGRGKGATSIRRFIDEVLDQVALQTSQHERAQFWVEESHASEPEGSLRAEAAGFLEEPPADTQVLLGYVKGADHHDWIRQEGLYNLRADGRTGSVELGGEELAAKLLLLYGNSPRLPELWSVGGPPRLFDRDQMKRRGYPTPRGQMYFCLPLGQPLGHGPVEELESDEVERWVRRIGGIVRGAPVASTWLRVAQQLLTEV